MLVALHGTEGRIYVPNPCIRVRLPIAHGEIKGAGQEGERRVRKAPLNGRDRVLVAREDTFEGQIVDCGLQVVL